MHKKIDFFNFPPPKFSLLLCFHFYVCVCASGGVGEWYFEEIFIKKRPKPFPSNFFSVFHFVDFKPVTNYVSGWDVRGMCVIWDRHPAALSAEAIVSGREKNGKTRAIEKKPFLCILSENRKKNAKRKLIEKSIEADRKFFMRKNVIYSLVQG